MLATMAKGEVQAGSDAVLEPRPHVPEKQAIGSKSDHWGVSTVLLS